MTLHILVEGPSEDAFLRFWLPRLKIADFSYRIHPHQGRGNLPRRLNIKVPANQRGVLDQLPAKLRAFARSLGDHDAVLVLIDADDSDQTNLATAIVGAATQLAPRLRFLLRFAVEETEAFYLGDLKALAAAFPHANMAEARRYRPDSIVGTWELFGRIIGDDGGNKVGWAEEMGPRLTTKPAASRSPSFRELVHGVRALGRRRQVTKAPRRYFHRSKKR